MTSAPEVQLQVVQQSDEELRLALAALRPLPDQERFSSAAARTLPEALVDPARTPFAIVHAGEPVGFGVLDREGILDDLVDAPQRAVLLRAFYVASDRQGRGLGTAAARAVPGLARSLHPEAELVVLTVNQENPAAVAAYLRAGFRDTGARYLGDQGPQHVLVAATG